MEQRNELIRVSRQHLVNTDNDGAVAHSVIPYNLATGYDIVYIGSSKCIIPEHQGNKLYVHSFVTNRLQNTLMTEKIKRWFQSPPYYTPAISRDFKYYCSCGITRDNKILYHAWDLEKMQCIDIIERMPKVSCHVLPDQPPSLVYQLEGVLYRQYFRAPETRHILSTGIAKISMLCMSRDGQLMAYTCYKDSFLYLMDVKNDRILASFDCRDLFKGIEDGTERPDISPFFKSLHGYFTDNNRYLLLTMPEFNHFFLYFCIIDVSTGRIKALKTEKKARIRRDRITLNHPFVLDNSGSWLYGDQTVIHTDTHQKLAVHLENYDKVINRTSFTREQAMHIRADIIRVYFDKINDKVLRAGDISLTPPTHQVDTWLQIVMEDGFIFYTQTQPDIPKVKEIRHHFMPPIKEKSLSILLALLNREKLRLNPGKVVIVEKEFPHSFYFMDIQTRSVLCSVRMYTDGFIFFTEPDSFAPCGWLYTNRPDYVLVYERETEQLLMPGDFKREIYLGIHNRKDVIQNALLGEKDYLFELKDLKKLDTQQKELIEKSRIELLPGINPSNLEKEVES